MSTQDNKGIFAELWNRRVPQFVATYIGICWGILQFLIFASNRYNLNGTLIDKFLIFAVVLLPAVFIYIYNHGRPGKDEWKSYEKILLPVNFILALVFAGLFTGNNNINAAPVEVQVTNDLGDTITRLVPSVSQSKSFAIFPMINKMDKAEDDWLKFGLSQVMKRDLEQDMRMFCLSPYSLGYGMKSNNTEITSNDVVFSKYLKIAKDRIVDYFVIGEYELSGEKITGNIKVYETKTGELFYEEKFESKDIFNTIDAFSKNLSDNLFLKENADNILVTDLPASDLITGNLDALKNMTLARNAGGLNQDLPTAIQYSDKAIELDPESPMIQSERASYYYSSGKVDDAIGFINSAIDLSEILPERQKFSIRQQYYIYKREMDKNLALLETWRKLYPRDYYPYSQLIDYYKLTQVINKAKEVAESALENGHGARVLKNLAGFEIAQSNFEKAESYIDQYYELFPDKNRLEDKQLAEIYLKKGEFEKAEKWYEQILLLNPNDHNLLINLSDVNIRKWNYEEAEQNILDALSSAKLKEDSISVYQSLIFYYFRTGNTKKFNEIADIHFYMASPPPYISSAFRHLQMSALYAMFSNEERVKEMGAIVETHSPQLYVTYNCVADFILTLVAEDKDAFLQAYSDPCKSLITNGTPTLSYLADGYIAKMEGNYADAIRLLETYIDTTGQDSDMFGGWVAECYRLNKQYDEAVNYCKNSLKAHPSEATILYELARSYHEMGRSKEALDIIKDIKTKIYMNSDENFGPYKRLIEFEKELTS